jgi:C-terminal processing protease CtpA/Prc
VVAHVKKGTMVLDFTSVAIISRYMAENFEDERYFWDVIDSDIAYLQVPSFETEEVFSGRKLENTKAIVLDLRGNPGGYLSTLANFAGRFETSSGVLEKEVSRNKTETTYIKPHGTTLRAPLFILLDSRSASAAEIFARYFQKKGRAKIIGDASAGRVNASRFFSEELGISRVVPFYVQVSVAKVALEDGEELEQHPVMPDYPCIPSESDLRERKDPCLLKAIALARKATGRTEELSDEVTSQVAALVASMNQYHDQQLKRPD